MAENLNGLISVIIPACNAQNTLARCLDSLLTQTYANLEIIVIDDGSTDNTAKICKEYAQKDKRIKFTSQKNSGAGTTRNKGLEFANGNYIGFIDADDFADTMTYQKALNRMQTDNTDIVKWAFANYYQGGKIYKKKYQVSPGVYQGQNKQTLTADIIRNKGIDNSVCNCLFKKEIINALDLSCINNMTQGEDLMFLLLCLQKAKSISVMSEDFLYYYYQRNSSISKKNYAFYIRDMCILIDKLDAFVQQDNIVLRQALYDRAVLITFSVILMQYYGADTSFSKRISEIKSFISTSEIRDILALADYKNIPYSKTVIVRLAYSGFYKTSCLIIIIMLFCYRLKNRIAI